MNKQVTSTARELTKDWSVGNCGLIWKFTYGIFFKKTMENNEKTERIAGAAEWKTIKNVCPSYHYEEDTKNGKWTKGKGQNG